MLSYWLCLLIPFCELVPDLASGHSPGEMGVKNNRFLRKMLPSDITDRLLNSLYIQHFII